MAREPLIPVVTETVRRADFTDAMLAPLHTLANQLLAEDEAHFRLHARANNLVHLFRRTDTGALVGFQFWRTLPLARPRWRAIVGGKLRIQPAFRRRALHLASGLRFYLDNQLRHPLTRYYRLSIASMLGYVSITSALARYEHFDPHASTDEGRALHAAFSRICAESDFHIDPATGLIHVGIVMTDETLAHQPARFFDKPQARRYAALNPGYRTNDCDVAFWFRFTPGNLAALARAIARARRPRP